MTFGSEKDYVGVRDGGNLWSVVSADRSSLRRDLMFSSEVEHWKARMYQSFME
jgi:hypothetical protein